MAPIVSRGTIGEVAKQPEKVDRARETSMGIRAHSEHISSRTTARNVPLSRLRALQGVLNVTASHSLSRRRAVLCDYATCSEPCKGQFVWHCHIDRTVLRAPDVGHGTSASPTRALLRDHPHANQPLGGASMCQRSRDRSPLGTSRLPVVTWGFPTRDCRRDLGHTKRPIKGALSVTPKRFAPTRIGRESFSSAISKGRPLGESFGRAKPKGRPSR